MNRPWRTGLFASIVLKNLLWLLIINGVEGIWVFNESPTIIQGLEVTRAPPRSCTLQPVIVCGSDGEQTDVACESDGAQTGAACASVTLFPGALVVVGHDHSISCGVSGAPAESVGISMSQHSFGCLPREIAPWLSTAPTPQLLVACARLY